VTEPPPLPSPAASRLARGALAGASATAILAGQFATNGAVYGLTFMGLAGGITFLLKDAFEASGRGAYVLAFIAPLLTIALMLLVYGSLFSGLCASAYLAFVRRNPLALGRFMIVVFAFLAVGTALGLISMRWLEARSEFHGTPLYSPMFFIWPGVFSLLAFAYATLRRIVVACH
jgi:hypothetical protein